MNRVNLDDYGRVVFFTGAGMSAESGVPTYRGQGGIWGEYDWQQFACQNAFDRDPDKVLDFHELRRTKVLACQPHAGHACMTDLQSKHSNVSVVTQNTDGMHQRAGSHGVIELHGSLWRLRHPDGSVTEDISAGAYQMRADPETGQPLRPDITWFSDRLNESMIRQAIEVISAADLLISIGTSGVVWPAASFPEYAVANGARLIEINPEENDASSLYQEHLRMTASEGLLQLFG